MRYRAAMIMLVPALAAMVAMSAAPAPARRYDAAASATATVSARIITGSARIGARFAPPMERMAPRHTTLSAADGRPVAALVYDFE